MLIERHIRTRLERDLTAVPAVALLGPRQVGKTTLAHRLRAEFHRETVYLDLERTSDLAKLDEAELYLSQHREKLIIIDEVQRRPTLFPLLRSLIDERIRDGDRASQFLLLGSASRDLLQQSSESLAGRISYLVLSPLEWEEISEDAHAGGVTMEQHWLRGGFPLSCLAIDDQTSWDWRKSFIDTYLERDIPNLGIGISSEVARRFWSMLAFDQGGTLNAARLAESLGVSGTTVRRYLDILSSLYMVRLLPPWSGNSLKRLVKTPKVFVRDSGLLHRLAGIPNLEVLSGHHLIGASWEGYALENLLNRLPDTWKASYYRTSAKAEIDLVLEGPSGEVVAVEIKRTLRPKLGKGFRNGYADVGATQGFFVVPTQESFPLADTIEATSLTEAIGCLEAMWRIHW